jgi:hypothetical protein
MTHHVRDLVSAAMDALSVRDEAKAVKILKLAINEMDGRSSSAKEPSGMVGCIAHRAPMESEFDPGNPNRARLVLVRSDSDRTDSSLPHSTTGETK